MPVTEPATVSGDASRAPGASVPPRIRRGLRDVWRDWRDAPEDRFGVLLTFVILTIVVSSLVDVGASYAQSLAAHAMSGAALVAAAHATGMRRRGRRIIQGVVGVALGALAFLSVVEAATDVAVPDPSRADPLWLLVVLVVPVIVIRRLTRHTVVGLRTVLGSVAAYLQIAVAYAALYQAVDVWSEGWLFGQPLTSSTYTYVSLTTISTLGIGDVVPATDTARLLLSSQAVLGQVFLVTVVAIVVARFATTRGE